MTHSLTASYKVYEKLKNEIDMLEEAYNSLGTELEKMEDTWVEATPIIGCLQTSMDVIKHILNEKKGLRDTQWRMIVELRKEYLNNERDNSTGTRYQ
jgi:chromosome segregation ATPase